MIAGVGTDLVRVARMARALQKRPRLPRRLLAESEWENFARAARPAEFLAKRFAAKEAFAKAAGSGVRAPVLLRRIAVLNNEAGRPMLNFAPPLLRWLRARRIGRAHLSLSDERLPGGDALACAVVVLEAEDEKPRARKKAAGNAETHRRAQAPKTKKEN